MRFFNEIPVGGGKSTQSIVGTHHAMTWNQDGQRIAGHRRSHGAGCTG